MLRVILRNSTGEALDSFDATDEENARLALAAKLAHGTWLLSGGDSIAVEEV